MTAPTRVARWLLAVALAAVAPAAVPGQPPKAAPAAPAVIRQQVILQPRQVWPDDQFENWALGEARTVDGARRRLDTLLTLQVDEIDRACQLTDAQKRKVRLLGWGDAKRVLDDYEAAKRRFNELGNDMQQLQEVMPLVQPVQAAVRTGPFQAGSLVAKALRHTLTDDQYARYDAVARERQAFQHRAQVALAVSTFEETVPLRDAQRTELLARLLKATKPVRPTGQYDTYLLMYQFDRLPEDAVRPLLTAPQWKAWTGMIAQYKGGFPNLRRNGLLVDGDDPPGAAQD